MIRVTLSDGQELEGMRPHFAVNESAFQNSYFLLVPMDSVEAVRNLALDTPLTIEALAKLLYVIPRNALARIQLLRQESGMQSKEHASEAEEPRSRRTDLTTVNDAMAKIFIGVKDFNIFIPTLHTMHECARMLIFVMLAIPEGEAWPKDALEDLHRIELLAHRDFVTALQTFCSQSTLPKEASEYFATMTREYKNICATFMSRPAEFLEHVDPNYRLTYAPEVMERERLHLLGLILKILCVLTQQSGAIKP
jgi:hypothetical protein